MKLGLCGGICGLITGGLCILGGALVLIVLPRLIQKEEFYIGFDKNGSYNELTQRWIEIPYYMSLQIWTFSIINLPEVINNGTHPKFSERGPYSFTLHQHKSKVEFSQNDTTVLYRNKYTYHFNQKLSCGNCRITDRVIIPDPIFQVIVFFQKSFLQSVIFNFHFFCTIYVLFFQMMFDGFESPLIHGICSKKLIKPICEGANIPEKIGFFYKQNDTDDGEFLVDTGLLNSKNLAKVLKYNGQPSLPSSYWYSEQARMINGSEELIPPGLSSSDRIYMFLGQLKRFFSLSFKETVNVAGVPAWRYTMPPELYDPHLIENRGFCNPSTPVYFDAITQPAGCLPRGFLDIGSTQLGNPRIYLSGSHFYYSPSAVYENFNGFTPPSVSNDETIFDIEPVRNFFFGPNINTWSLLIFFLICEGVRGNIPNMIVPVLWFNETVLFDNTTRSELLDNLFATKNKACHIYCFE
uniref:Scavenger receptor class B member 1 n=1 Tax=Syphacia muris TaxID=451379 RepID=A0A0N5AEC2_9BILA